MDFHNPDKLKTEVVQIIEALGSDQFFESLSKVLPSCFCFEAMGATILSHTEAPHPVFDHHKSLDLTRGMQNYIRYTYVLDPIYRGFRSGVEAGVFLISDLMSPDFEEHISASDLDIHLDDQELIGYRSPGWPKNYPQVSLLTRLPGNIAIDLYFLTRAEGSHTEDCRIVLTELFPILQATLNKQFELCPQTFKTKHFKAQAEDKFQRFGEEVLTTREREIVQLIFGGHGSESIALNLDLAVSTVKSHRRSVYAKLEISSQAQLFSLLLQHLQ